MKGFNADRNWLKRKAAQEDGCFVSVGGSLLDRQEEAPSEVSFAMRPAFARLVQLARRERRLTLEQFAYRADVALGQLVNIEREERFRPTPRTVHQIATFLGLPAQKLMALAGLLQVEDAEFQQAAIRFAARAEPLEAPTPEEHAAFEEYVKLLCGR